MKSAYLQHKDALDEYSLIYTKVIFLEQHSLSQQPICCSHPNIISSEQYCNSLIGDQGSRSNIETIVHARILILTAILK